MQASTHAQRRSRRLRRGKPQPVVQSSKPPPPPAAAFRAEEHSIAVVLGTYNRRQYLQLAIASLRRATGGLNYQAIVVDGGSTDGSRDWLRAQADVILIEQSGPLTGAVRAFNLGFAEAVRREYRYVGHFNDDAEYMTPAMLASAVAILEAEPRAGAVAFAFDLRGRYGFDQVHGKVYSNFGVIRAEAGIQAARAQGDPNGEQWWNPIYHTYGADTELGCWLWKLGWQVHAAESLQVHDANCDDAIRRSNNAKKGPIGTHPDSVLFWQRWADPKQLEP